MSRVNKLGTSTTTTHEGGTAQRVSPLLELKRTVLTCMLWENTFYESGDSIADRIADLVTKVSPMDVSKLAYEARDAMYLRHVPLYLVRELARQKGNGALVEDALSHVIQRADELAEFLAIYWKDGKVPVANAVKRGLALAFNKFNAYQLAKYDRPGDVKLRDVLFICHAKPNSTQQTEDWKSLVEGTLPSPDTWESNLVAGENKKETFTRLLTEKKLGSLAVLRNLRLMIQEGVDEQLIVSRLIAGPFRKTLPYRFVTAARYNPNLERHIEHAMFAAAVELPCISGRTGILVDVSGSMESKMSSKSEATCMDVAAALAIHLSEKCTELRVATFSNDVVIVPPRRGFAFRDAIVNSQIHSRTYLKSALVDLHDNHGWDTLDRVIVITDEQSHDGVRTGWAPWSYMINVGSYKNGVSYGNGWTHIDGWSERVIDYMLAVEETGARSDDE